MPTIRDARVSADGAAVEVVTVHGPDLDRIPLARAASRIREFPPGERPGYLRTLLAGVVEMAAAGRAPEKRGQGTLLPMVFSAEHFNVHAARVSRAAAEVVAGVAEIVVVDRPNSAEEVTSAHLDRLGITAEQALQDARANLARVPESGRWERVPGTALWEWVGGDFYAASRVFTPGWLARAGLPGTGRMFVAVPSRDLVLAGRVREVGPDLARIVDLVHNAWTRSSQPVSPILYSIDSPGGALCPLAVKGDRHAARELRRSELSHLVTAYTRQAQHHTDTAEEHWLELRVGRFEGKEVTVTAWTGASTGDLLPRAEYVMVPPVIDDVVVPWETFREVAGDCVQPEPGAIPERWRTVRDLTSAQLAELAERTAVRRPG